MATSCEELTHWKRPWCWEGLGARGEGDDRGWDGWMASLTRWTWVWVNSGSWWWTRRPGVLQFMGSQRVGHDRGTDLIWSESSVCGCVQLFCLPMVCDLPGSSVHGISQARMWRRLPFLPPGDLPDPGVNSCLLQTHGGFFTTEAPGNYSWPNWKEGRRTYKGISLHDTDSQHYGPDSWPQVHRKTHLPGLGIGWDQQPLQGMMELSITRPAWVWNLYLEGLSSCRWWAGNSGACRVNRKSRGLHCCAYCTLVCSSSCWSSLHSTSLRISRFQVGKGRCKRKNVS